MKSIFWFLLLFTIVGAAFALGSHGDHQHHGHHHHQHKQLDVADWPQQPEVALEVMRDAAAGWNVHIKTKNFQFAPERVNGEVIPGEGHAHIFVDDKKVARVYGAWFHLDKLTSGQHTIRVTLNANDHSDLASAGEVIAAVVNVAQ